MIHFNMVCKSQGLKRMTRLLVVAVSFQLTTAVLDAEDERLLTDIYNDFCPGTFICQGSKTHSSLEMTSCCRGKVSDY